MLLQHQTPGNKAWDSFICLHPLCHLAVYSPKAPAVIEPLLLRQCPQSASAEAFLQSRSIPAVQQTVAPPLRYRCFSNELDKSFKSRKNRKQPEKGRCLHGSLARSVWERAILMGCPQHGWVGELFSRLAEPAWVFLLEQLPLVISQLQGRTVCFLLLLRSELQRSARVRVPGEAEQLHSSLKAKP